MASSALMPPSASDVPTQDDRPVVVQCPYTLSSCPLFNPTFTTAEVLDAGRNTGSACGGVAPSPRERNMPGEIASTGASRSSESPRRYGLVESMRKAASPPSHTVELDEASPFQYIDFPIAPLEEASTPRCPAQASSVSPRLQGLASGPTTPPEIAARVQLEVRKPVAASAQPTYQYHPQQPSLYGDVSGRSRVASGSSIVFGNGEMDDPAYTSTSSLIRPQTAATYTGGTYPSITMPRRFSAESPVGTSFPSRDSGYADLGQPDLSVAYELAGMASRSRTSHSPLSPPSQPSFLQQSTLQGIAGANGTLSSGVVLPYVEQDRHSSHSRASSAEQQVEPQDTGGQLYASGHTPGQPKAATPFISKLNHLLSDPSYADVIRWNEDGTVILYAHTSPRLLDILGRFFRHTTVSSFARQLNIYAFHRLNTSELLTQLEKSRSVGVRGCASEWSGFSHELMWRDDPNKPTCDLGRLKPSGPKTEKGKQNLAKKIAENGGSVKKRKKAGPSTTRNASPKEDSE